MHTFFPSKKLKGRFLISGDEFKHLKIRRIRVGEDIGVIWGGDIYLCRLESFSGKEALCVPLKRLVSSSPPVELTLLQAVPVNIKTFEFILQKATELGAVRVVPLITERSFRNIRILKEKRERWERIVREAMKQSLRPYELELDEPKPIEEIEAEWDVNLLLDNFMEGKGVEELKLKEGDRVCIVVGPEGGFSERETKALRERGFIPIRLRPHVLRTETAAVVGMGIIMNVARS